MRLNMSLPAVSFFQGPQAAPHPLNTPIRSQHPSDALEIHIAGHLVHDATGPSEENFVSIASAQIELTWKAKPELRFDKTTMDEGHTFQAEWLAGQDKERKHDKREFTVAHQVRGGKALVFNDQSKVRWDKFSKAVMNHFIEFIVCGDFRMDIDEPKDEISENEPVSATSERSESTLVDLDDVNLMAAMDIIDITPKGKPAQQPVLKLPILQQTDVQPMQQAHPQIQQPTQPQQLLSYDHLFKQGQLFKKEDLAGQERSSQEKKALYQQHQPSYFAPAAQEFQPIPFTKAGNVKSAAELLSQVDRKLSRCQQDFRDQMGLMRLLWGDMCALKGLGMKRKHSSLYDWQILDMEDMIDEANDEWNDIAMEYGPSRKRDFIY